MSEIRIETERNDYCGGEQVKGKVVIELDQPLPARGVRVTFLGQERCFWADGFSRNQTTHLHTKEHVDEALTLWGKPPLAITEVLRDAVKGMFSKNAFEVLDAGTHDYPFTFDLPKNLPGDYESRRGSSIRYELHAELDVPLKIDLEVRKRLAVHEKPTTDEAGDEPASARATLELEGAPKLKLAAEVGRSTFRPGDQASCKVTIENGSSKPINGVTLLLRQVEDLVPKDVVFHNHDDFELAKEGQPDISQGEPAELAFDFQLPDKLYATIKAGALVNVRYELVVQVDLPWARSPELAVPIVVVEDPGKPSGGVAS
ncbi:MAG: arrestin family protein [Deltaproteobacteria bacterium]|nr:arrestin family protein [Deltaproteobacteria bacterium]